MDMYDPNSDLTLEDIEAARKRLKESTHCVRTPTLTEVQYLIPQKDVKLYLKLENMQIAGTCDI